MTKHAGKNPAGGRSKSDCYADKGYTFLDMGSKNLEDYTLADCLVQLLLQVVASSGSNTISDKTMVSSEDVLKIFKFSKMVQPEIFSENKGTRTISFGEECEEELISQSILGEQYFSLVSLILFSNRYLDDDSEDKGLEIRIAK